MARKQDDSPVGSDADSPTIYSITVNYGRTLAEMVEAGYYDYANPDITAEHFPIEGRGKVELECELVHHDRTASTEEVEPEIERLGLRPATIEELLAFGETYPDVQREFPVVELGSSWVNRDGHRDMVSLWGYPDSRSLILGWDAPGYQWSSRYRFLTVRT